MKRKFSELEYIDYEGERGKLRGQGLCDTSLKQRRLIRQRIRCIHRYLTRINFLLEKKNLEPIYLYDQIKEEEAKKILQERKLKFIISKDDATNFYIDWVYNLYYFNQNENGKFERSRIFINIEEDTTNIFYQCQKDVIRNNSHDRNHLNQFFRIDHFLENFSRIFKFHLHKQIDFKRSFRESLIITKLIPKRIFSLLCFAKQNDNKVWKNLPKEIIKEICDKI